MREGSAVERAPLSTTHPGDVVVNGGLRVEGRIDWSAGTDSALINFWRSVENLSIVPTGGTTRWAVSQASPMRRVHIRGGVELMPAWWGYSSGGFIANSRIDGQVQSGSQQQWYTRDSNYGSWNGGVWNMVFSGVTGAPANAFPTPPHTTLATTPVSREKPYLYIDGAGKYRVFVPALRTNAAGASWANGPTAGSSIPMSQFYVAKPGDSAARLNAALAQGLHLFFTPGTYHLEDTIRVTRANTVVLGIGFPTLVPDKGVNAMSVADVDGVKLAGLLFDAGTVNSQALLTVGPAGASARHAANPTTVQDVFFRIGGAVAGKATNSLIVNSHDTIIDHIWAWRADHGSFPTGWTVNPADTGVVVNGNHVLATGLFVEHYQKYQVIWNGQNGRTIFFQSEMPYDPPNQSTWRSDALGYAAYKVADSVTSHEAWGVGAYCFFNIDPSIHAGRGFEVEDGFAHEDGSPNEDMPSMLIVFRFEPTPAGRALAPDAEDAPPYPGAKPYLLIDGDETAPQHAAERIAQFITRHRIAVLNFGELQQIGTPREIYEEPANVFVAGFIGSPQMNLFKGTIRRVGDKLLFTEDNAQLVKVSGAMLSEVGLEDFSIGMKQHPGEGLAEDGQLDQQVWAKLTADGCQRCPTADATRSSRMAAKKPVAAAD